MSETIIEDDKPKIIHRVFKGEIDDVSKEKRTVVSIITTDRVDHYKEVIVAKGIDLDIFRENPIVLWCHCPETPIGKNLWLKRYTKDGKSGIIAKTLFAKTAKADEIFQLYVDEILNGWSIGANVDWSKFGPATEEELKDHPEWKKCRGVYRKSTLLEYSAVSIPANPDALGNEIGKQISADLRRELESAGSWKDVLGDEAEQPVPITKQLPPLVALPPLVGRTFDQVLAATKSVVAGMTSPEAAKLAAVETLDRLKGRV